MRNAPKNEERRRSQRASHHIPVLLTSNKSQRRISRKVAAVTINASRNGVLLRIGDDFNFALGDTVHMELLGGGKESSFPSFYNIKLNGKIVRIDGSVVAVSFEDGNEDTIS